MACQSPSSRCRTLRTSGRGLGVRRLDRVNGRLSEPSYFRTCQPIDMRCRHRRQTQKQKPCQNPDIWARCCQPPAGFRAVLAWLHGVSSEIDMPPSGVQRPFPPDLSPVRLPSSAVKSGNPSHRPFVMLRCRASCSGALLLRKCPTRGSTDRKPA